MTWGASPFFHLIVFFTVKVLSSHYLLIRPLAACNGAKADRSVPWWLPFASQAPCNEIAGDANGVEAIRVGRFRWSYGLLVVMRVTLMV